MATNFHEKSLPNKLRSLAADIEQYAYRNDLPELNAMDQTLRELAEEIDHTPSYADVREDSMRQHMPRGAQAQPEGEGP